MVKLYIYIFLFLFSLITVGCNDRILEEKNASNLTADTYYSTAKGIEDGVNATYSFLKKFHAGDGGANSLGYGLTEGGTDIQRLARAFVALNTYDKNLNSSSEAIEVGWKVLYKGINTANTVISRAPEVDMDKEVRQNKIAEVRFLRAYYYFLLVQTWGDVPMKTKETVGVQVTAERTPVDQIYNKVIIPDLEFAITNLPSEQDDFGRATKPAAESMLTRVYMVLKEWQKAEQLAKSVINNYNFAIVRDYGSIWAGAHPTNSEVIWSVQFTRDPLVSGTNMGSVYFTPWYTKEKGLNPSPQNDGTYVKFRSTHYLLTLFDRSKDRRYDEGFKDVWYANTNAPGIAVGDTALYYSLDTLSTAYKKNKPYKIYDFNDMFEVNWAWPQPVKVRNEERTSRSDKRFKDYIVIRISEMYLNLAEALLKQGKIDEATTYINKLRRKRAWPGKEQEMEISSSELDMDFILDERARELFAEGTRWFTLKRTGTLVKRVKKYNKPAAAHIQGYHRLRPIPQTQIDRTKNKFPQNPGY